jgi:DNA-binding GntR family transcriptional regulator
MKTSKRATLRAAAAGAPLQLADSAYGNLKRMIIDLDLAPGSLFSEKDVMEMVGATRASIRAALQRLCQEGLVLSQPRKGFLVSALTIKDALDLFEMRRLLEPRAAYLSAGRITEDIHAPLLKRIADGYSINDRASIDTYLQANREFLLTFGKASNNLRLQRAIEDISDARSRYARVSFDADNTQWDAAFEMYTELSNLVCAGQAKDAYEFALKYVDSVRDHVITALSSRPEIVGQSLLVPTSTLRRPDLRPS